MKSESPLFAIREKCLDCCAGSNLEVKMCVIQDCSLYPFRLGKNPYLKRILTEEQKEARTQTLKRYQQMNG